SARRSVLPSIALSTVPRAQTAWAGKDKHLHKAEAEPSNLFWSQRAYPEGQISREQIKLARESARLALPRAGPTLGDDRWEFIGPKPILSPQAYRTPFYNNFAFPTSAHIEALALDPRNSSIIYAGSAGGGLWKTVDG